jgi:hypothetical protein
MNSKLRLPLLLLFFPLMALSVEPLRTFTDAKGRAVRAALVSVQNGQVTLRLENGRQHTLGIATLSAGDQQWLKTQEAERPAGPSAEMLPGGMVFSQNWLPQTLTAKRELLESLDLYCKAAVGNAPKGQEPIPATIVGGIHWRMPLDEALQTLPPGFNKLNERPMVHPCLPNDSLILCGFQFKSFEDRGQPFNQMFLLVDKERKVVSVQFVDQTGKGAKWLPAPDGIREPYYNLISLTHNGSSGKEVPYQILSGGSGVVCIKTAFQDRTGMTRNIPKLPPNIPNMPTNMPSMSSGGRIYENVHWYIPAPFARAILDIVDVYRRSGVIQ